MIRLTMAALLAAFCTVAVTSQAEAKRHHSGAYHTAKHFAVRHHSPRNAAPDVSFDVAARPAYPVEMTRTGPRQRAIEPMGRRLVAPSNGWDLAYEGHIIGHPAGCPRSAFCGCGASVHIFGHPVRELYLAANWFKFASAFPAPGMVAVRRHHVFVIESVNSDGTVVAWDANSGGHATRIHTVSLRGYSVRDPHSMRAASHEQTIR